MKSRPYFNVMFLITFLFEFILTLQPYLNYQKNVVFDRIILSNFFIWNLYYFRKKIALFVNFLYSMAPIIILIENFYMAINYGSDAIFEKNRSIIFYAICTLTPFDILFKILFIIMWKKNFVILRTNFFLSQTNGDMSLSGIFISLTFLPSFILLCSSKIIKKELRFHMFFIYLACIGQILIFAKYSFDGMSPNSMTCIITLILLVTFDPDLGKEYEYSNDLSLDINNDEEEKDEISSETLNRYWKTIKTIFYNGVILQILDLIE
ncbi:hypothetical protein GLOIN_2v1569580 [Rhizophagus clarus]|uniref:Uncharacterized protein n=1 Tax=Rhizophagus clarus TaxID=94130 RepID=A0A8H3QS18_9GLOM|nr:hypothetical protein GLOIN_2v1569580 [Rhizophagus clarus]